MLPGVPSAVPAAWAVSADHAIHDGTLQRAPSRKLKGVWCWRERGGGTSVCDSSPAPPPKISSFPLI